MRYISFLVILTISIINLSCSGIKLLTPEEIYSEDFLNKIEGIQSIYKDGDKAGALAKLEAFDDNKLSTDEKGKKYNFIGIIYFSETDYIKASENFEISLKNIRLDKPLKAQVKLNLASSYYKLEKTESAYNLLENVETNYYTKEEKVKYAKLKLILAQTLNKPKAIVESLIFILKDKKTFEAINESEYKTLLLDNFRQLSSSERVYLLEKNQKDDAIVIPFLGSEEAMQRYYFGDRPGAQDVLDWLEKNFMRYQDVEDFVSEFNHRIANFSKIDVGAVGVVLPLSGEKQNFGKKALMGIDTALNITQNKVLSVKIYSRNNKDNPVVAKEVIHDLIQKHHVSIIIGGLFPSTAKEEYLEARKYGVLFISLSPVHLDKEEKNHLLIEIPGSIQSQVSALFSDKFLDTFGHRVAMFYPENEGGYAYVNEVWRRAKEGKIQLTALSSYDKNAKDYREWVKKLLGLKYTRERQEEFDLWKEIYSLEKKKSSIRRIQILKPVVDFDWVFVPSYPQEAVQIIPAFSYFDAKGLKYVGSPSWLSRKLLQEQRNLGKLFFVGDDPKDFDKSFTDVFKERNAKSPGLVETLSYEAMNLALGIVEGTKFEQREELERKLINLQTIKGITGSWTLHDGIWIKDMDIMKIAQKNISKIDMETHTEEKAVEQ